MRKKYNYNIKKIKNKNIVLIILLIAIAGSIYYLNSQKASPKDFVDNGGLSVERGKIAEGMVKPSDTAQVDYGKIETPEIYFGYALTRGNFGNEQGLIPNEIIDYRLPSIVKKNRVYLGGRWKINQDNVELAGDEGKIMLGYNAKSVNIVAGSDAGSEVEVLVDTRMLNESKVGSDVKIINNKSVSTIKEERLYNLVDYEYGPGLLELRIKGKGFKIYTFTFG